MSQQSSRTPLKVLVVEDEEEDFQMLLRQLRRGSYEVEATRVAERAGISCSPRARGHRFDFRRLSAARLQCAERVTGLPGERTGCAFYRHLRSDWRRNRSPCGGPGCQRLSAEGKPFEVNSVVDRELRDSKIRRENRLLRMERMQAGADESAAGTFVRLHLEAVRRILTRSQNPANRQRLEALLEEIEELAAETLASSG